MLLTISRSAAVLLLVAAFCSSVTAQDNKAATASIPFTQITVAASPPDSPWYKMAGDLDGDGDLDLIVGGAKGPLLWYLNPTWEPVKIAAGGWDGVNGEVADIDGDGDADLVMGGVVWFRNPGIGGEQWTMMRIDRRRAHDIEIGDVNGDGRLDVVARDQSAFGSTGNEISVYLQQDPDTWRKITLPCPHGEGLKLADIDGDNDPDIVIGAQWYENTQRFDVEGWPSHVYSRQWTEPDTKVETADFNGDGRLDIVLTPAERAGEHFKVAWYEAPENRKSADWKEHVVVPSIECVIHSLGTGDLDNDGDVDLAIAEMHQGADPDEVSVLLNNNRGTRWQQQVLSRGGSHDIIVADMDGDGDLDIVGANHAGAAALEWWRNDSR